MATRTRTGSGVEVRPNSLRIKFVLDGITHKPTLTLNGQPMLPTAGNRKYAEMQGLKIRKCIELGTFTWAEFFPDSAQAKELAQAEAAPVQTFGTVADAWLRSKGQLEHATRDQYANAVAIWKRVLGEHTKFERLSYQTLAAKIGGHPWASAKSCNNYLIPLRGIFEFNFHGPAAMLNPMLSIKNMKLVKKLPDPLTAAERDNILGDMAAHYDERITAYFAFAFFTGMRPEELIALQWGDIDFNARLARVQRVRTFRGTERDGSKTHAVRDVELGSHALDALQTMKAHTFLQRDTSAPIFQHPVTGRPFHDERAQRDTFWAPTLRRLGIRSRRCYATRHTYATVLLMHGVPPAYIAHQLGHKDSKQVHEKYARWINQADNGRARALMESAFGAPAGVAQALAQERPETPKKAIHGPKLKRVS
jgi:integrase